MGKICTFCKYNESKDKCGLIESMASVKHTERCTCYEPVKNVAPVIHAHWEIIYESSAGVTDARCSNCGYESLAYENDVHTDENCNYCPCCGAKMDEAEIIGKRMIDGFIDGMGNNVKSVGQQLCNDEE